MKRTLPAYLLFIKSESNGQIFCFLGYSGEADFNENDAQFCNYGFPSGEKKVGNDPLWLERRCMVFQCCSRLVSCLLFLDLASQKQQMSSLWTCFSRIHCHSYTDG